MFYSIYYIYTEFAPYNFCNSSSNFLLNYKKKLFLNDSFNLIYFQKFDDLISHRLIKFNFFSPNRPQKRRSSKTKNDWKAFVVIFSPLKLLEGFLVITTSLSFDDNYYLLK